MGNQCTDAPPTVAVVDDDPGIRQSLRWLLESAHLKVETFGAPQEFLHALKPHIPECVILDVRVPGMSGLDLLEHLATQEIMVPAIILTAYGDVPMAVRAMKAGATDFIEKPYNDQALLEAVQRTIDYAVRTRRKHAERREIAQRLARLTTRERQVMDLVVVGRANKQIAAELGCSGKTVEIHRARVMEKTGARSVAGLVRMALTVARETG